MERGASVARGRRPRGGGSVKRAGRVALAVASVAAGLLPVGPAAAAVTSAATNGGLYGFCHVAFGPAQWSDVSRPRVSVACRYDPAAGGGAAAYRLGIYVRFSSTATSKPTPSCVGSAGAWSACGDTFQSQVPQVTVDTATSGELRYHFTTGNITCDGNGASPEIETPGRCSAVNRAAGEVRRFDVASYGPVWNGSLWYTSAATPWFHLATTAQEVCAVNTVCDASMPEEFFDGTAPGPVSPVAIDCYREFYSTPQGHPAVRVRLRVENPQDGGHDVPAIRFPWEPADRNGAYQQDAELPANPPAGGWKVLCKVTRTLADGSVGTDGWKTGATVVQDTSPDNLVLNPKNSQNTYASDPPPVGALAPWIVAPGAVAGGSTAVAVAAGMASAYVGYLAGGWAAAKANFHGDDEWFCRHNSSYRSAAQWPTGSVSIPGQTYCQFLVDNRPYVRTQGQFRDPTGTPLDGSGPAAWRSQTTVQELVVDPSTQVRTDGTQDPGRQSQGARGTSAFDDPTMTSTQTSGLTDAESGPTGSTRATNQAGPAPVDGDPAPNPQPPPTGPPEAAAGCNETFFQFLNPLNIAETMGCVLRKLFVPAAGFGGLAALWGDLSTKAPFSVVTLVEIPGQAMARARDAVPGAGCYQVAIPLPNSTDRLSLTCSDGTGLASQLVDSESGNPWVPLIRNLLLWGMYLGFGFSAVWLLTGVVTK